MNDDKYIVPHDMCGKLHNLFNKEAAHNLNFRVFYPLYLTATRTIKRKRKHFAD